MTTTSPRTVGYKTAYPLFTFFNFNNACKIIILFILPVNKQPLSP